MLHRETATLTADTTARTITARLCNYDEPRQVTVNDGTFAETFERGSVSLADRVHVVDEHTGNLVGRAVELREDDHGPTVTLQIAPTVAGSDLLALVDAGVLDSVSMEFDPEDGDEWSTDRTAVTRHRAVVHGVAFAFRPAHAAPILTRQQERHAMPEVTAMPDTSPVPPATLTTEPVTPELLERSLAGIRDELARATANPVGLTVSAPAHPLAEYRSLVDYADAVWAGTVAPDLLHRALADQITTPNVGVIPPGWVNEVFGILEQSRPLIDAFGTEPLPPAGMDVNWPYFNGDLLTLVGEQTTQKSAITSVVVSLLKGTAPLHTYAGGSDISYQLIRRSAPAYRDAYLRIMYAAYAAVTDKAAGTLMLAVAGRGNIVLDPLTATADTLRAALFGASAKVELATGSPATFAIASSDVFVKLGGLPNLFPVMYGTNNASGTADASSLRIEVSGLQIINDPFLPANSLHVSNGQAASWFEEGPMTVAVEDVEKLGQNVAVWGMGTFAAHVPKGIVQISTTPPPLADDEDAPATSKRGKSAD
jgi:HK97 family phage prohead protease